VTPRAREKGRGQRGDTAEEAAAAASAPTASHRIASSIVDERMDLGERVACRVREPGWHFV